MVDSGDLDASNIMHMEYLWFSFNKVIENELSQVQSNWNNHCIHKSRYQTVSGTPEKLYFLPEEMGSEDYKQPFDPADLQVQSSNDGGASDEENETSDYHCYFNYVLQTLEINCPTNWRESLSLYRTLLSAAI